MATYDDFLKIDIRTGRIISAEEFPEAKKPAYRLKIDFGPLGIKKSSVQVTKDYRPRDLVGRQVVAVVNFPPKQVANFVSEVLVLGVVPEEGRVILLKPDKESPPGKRIL
jgi:tRNA-binding protein